MDAPPPLKSTTKIGSPQTKGSKGTCQLLNSPIVFPMYSYRENSIA